MLSYEFVITHKYEVYEKTKYLMITFKNKKNLAVIFYSNFKTRKLAAIYWKLNLIT